MKKEKIIFQSYNPYQTVCPVTRVVSRETLHLIKMFRSKGIDISVEPEDNSTLSYFTKRGWQDIYRIPLIIEAEDNGNKRKYSYDGELIDNDLLLDIQIRMTQSNNRLKTLFSSPPSFTQPFPVYLEHSNQVIGWADKLFQDPLGVTVEGLKIINADIWQRIQSGELQGFSIAAIVTSSECSICKKEYTECNHIPPNTYRGKKVANKIKKACLAEVSIVKEPIEPLAKIKEISFKENHGGIS